MRNKILYILFFIVLFQSAQCQIEITLKKSFVEEYKDKITVNLDFSISSSNEDKVVLNHDFYTGKDYRKPKSPGPESSLMMTGISNKAGLPIAVRVLNAGSRPDLLDFVSDDKKAGKKINIKGVWKLWCEYSADIKQEQGKDFSDTNTDYVFEINPVLKIGSINLSPGPDDTKGLWYEEPQSVFGRYSSLKCEITIGDSTISINTQGAGYALTGFEIQITGKSVFKKTEALLWPTFMILTDRFLQRT